MTPEPMSHECSTCEEPFPAQRREGNVSSHARHKIIGILAVVACGIVVILGAYDENAAVGKDLDAVGDFLDPGSDSSVFLEQQSSALETALMRFKKNKGKKYCDHAVSQQISIKKPFFL
jgi:hypothetical protein